MDVILGAGLSGLICGALNARSIIYERNPPDIVQHRAVLRFRDDKIARALGLTFRRVTVRKAVWYEGREVSVTPRLANYYSLKTRGIIADNSIWNLAPSERFIAPDDLHAVLADMCGSRVKWNTPISSTTDIHEVVIPVISTIPLPSLLSILDHHSPLTFNYSPIYVNRYSVPDCDVFQTVYFPSPHFNVYRATLTGSLLTIERSGDGESNRHEDVMMEGTDAVVSAFGLDGIKLTPLLLKHRQSFGKIAPVDDLSRKGLLHQLTQQYRIYSLGRFATWRNILLDDVFDDIAVIRKMIAQSPYDVNLERMKS